MIDLSKLKALELPKEEIEIEILGETQKTVITALPMTLAVKVSNIATIRGDDPNLTTDVLREVLKAGAKELSAEDIDLLLEFAYPAAAEIAAKIRDLTKKFNEQKFEKKSEIEKNSAAVKSGTENLS
jgi:hypothetical protein